MNQIAVLNEVQRSNSIMVLEQRVHNDSTFMMLSILFLCCDMRGRTKELKNQNLAGLLSHSVTLDTHIWVNYFKLFVSKNYELLGTHSPRQIDKISKRKKVI